MILQTDPQSDGFLMVADFSKHRCTWMIWPERTDVWPFGAKLAQHSFVELADAISKHEPVMLGASEDQYGNAQSQVSPETTVIELSNNDCWMRDTGPVFVANKEGHIRAVHFAFNAWGGLSEGLYFPWDKDSEIPLKVAEVQGLDLYKSPLILEGGSIATDGEGTLLATEQCLLNPNRNGGLTKQDIEAELSRMLGVSRILWLPKGLHLDEAGGHIDNLCAFVAPSKVMLAWTDDRQNPNYQVCSDAFEVLSTAQDAKGRNFDIVKVPLPPPLYLTAEESATIDVVDGSQPRHEGDWLCGSYINFHFVNEAVLVPQFDETTDSEVIGLFRAVMPQRTVIPVQSRSILVGGGNLHCVLLGEPACTSEAK